MYGILTLYTTDSDLGLINNIKISIRGQKHKLKRLEKILAWCLEVCPCLFLSFQLSSGLFWGLWEPE